MLGWTSIATTYVVRPDGAGDFPTIQEAITASGTGDVIELTDATLRGDGNRDLDAGRRSIPIRPQSDGPEACNIAENTPFCNPVGGELQAKADRSGQGEVESARSRADARRTDRSALLQRMAD